MNGQRGVVMVTGAGQGIGRAVAERLIADGWAVVLLEIDREAGEETAATIGGRGTVRLFCADVAEETQVAAAAEYVRSTFGRLDALINNAGIAKAHGLPVERLPLEDWNRVLAVNLTGPFLCSKHCAALLRAANGSIVNIASTRAMMSEGNTEAYSASKGGLVALTHALAVSLGPDVRVNCISPGWIDAAKWRKRSLRGESSVRPQDHAWHPAGRVGRPEDVAAAVAFLLSADASFITGTNLVLDGGMTRKMVYLE